MSRTSSAVADPHQPDTAGSRVEHVVLTMGQRIVSGVYAPGSTLPTEQEISAELNVGRNVTREAIKVLAGKGFVRTGRRAGTIVQPQGHWNMLDHEVLSWASRNPAIRHDLLANLTDVRRIIEPEVAALAAKNATTTDTLRIFEAYEDMERHARNRDLAIVADINFHTRLFEAARNPLLASIARSFAVLLRANFETSMKREGAYIRNLVEHRRIAEAIHRRDADAARAEMLQLLAKNDADLREMMSAGEAKHGPREAKKPVRRAGARQRR